MSLGKRAGSPVPESREVRDESFWRAGGNFRWCWPKFDLFRPADRRRRAGLNRYPHNVIGAYVVLFGRGWGIEEGDRQPWRRPVTIGGKPEMVTVWLCEQCR